MRKTFLKVALIGALAVAMPSTFTSCKDYDTDIENLNTQTADLKSQLASVNAAIAALPTKADVSAAQAAAVAQAKSDLNAVKAQLEAAIAGKADKATVDAIQEELSNIKGQLETIEALKGDIQTALEAINNSITSLNEDAEAKGQMIAGLEAQIAELKESTGNVGDLVADVAALKEAVNDPESGLAALKAQIAELAEKIQGAGGEAASLEATLRVVNGMVTSLRIVSDWGASEKDCALNLYNPITVDKTPVGPKGEALLFDLKAGDQKDFTDSLLVQVSPAGATLNTEDITLVDSKLRTIEDFVTISEIRKYTEENDLLTRAASANGLYVVYFTQNPKYDFKADADQANTNKTQTNFAKATKANDGKGDAIRFAIALTETNDGGARDVMTPYDITVNGGTISATTTLNFNVDDEPVANIHNRFLYAEDNSSYMYQESAVSNAMQNMTGVYGKASAIASYEAAVAQGYAPVGDYAWLNGVAVFADPTHFATAPYNDNRTPMPFYPVEMGEPFTVSLTAQNIYGYYVAIDTYRATESGESEIAAWTKYAENIDGINTLYKSGDIEMTINEAANVPAGDVIGFRVWAVNYDGSLVDPDGRAFYVQVGDAAAVETSALVAKINATVDANGPSLPAATIESYNDVLGWTTAYSSVSATFTMTNNSKTHLAANSKSTVTVTLGNGATLTAAMDGKASAAVTINASDYAKIFKNIEVSISDYQFVDNQTYNGVITLTGTNGLSKQVVQEIPVRVTKTVPTGLPTTFIVAAGLGSADADANIYVNDGSAADGVSAAFNNVFRIFNAPLNSASEQWSNFAFLMKLADATQATWSKPGDPAYYTNWIYDVKDPTLKFVGAPYQDVDGSAIYTLNKTITNLGTGLGTLVTGKVIPTLDIVNGAVQTLNIYYQYNGIGFRAAEEGKAPAAAAVIGSGSKTIKVQTYANTYTLDVPDMPTLYFGQNAYINYDAITLTSSALPAVKNSTIETVKGLGLDQKIGEVNISLDGTPNQYFNKPTLVKDATVSIDPETGAATYCPDATKPTVVYPVSGVPVKAVVEDGKTVYYAEDGTSETVTITLVAIVPNDKTNAPSSALNGTLNISFLDGFGLGSGFDMTKKEIIPYTIGKPISMKLPE